MSLKSTFKQFGPLRREVKKLKVYREYFADARFLNRYLLDGGRSAGHLEYQIVVRSHALEKGLSHRDPRPFGSSKAILLTGLLEQAAKHGENSALTAMGWSVLEAWTVFHSERGWDDAPGVEQVRTWLRANELGRTAVPAGVRTFNGADPARWRDLPIDDFMFSRYSARRYAATPVPDALVDDAVALALSAPSACNRQMVRVALFDDDERKQILYRTLHGTGGIDYDTCRLGVVTFDSRSLDFYGERNQGYLNAGLFAMSLVYGLHWQGIGSCLLQFGNSSAEERALAKALRLPPYMRIAVGISLGFYDGADVAPASTRRPISEVVQYAGRFEQKQGA